jgi:hypothetical protein
MRMMILRALRRVDALSSAQALGSRRVSAVHVDAAPRLSLSEPGGILG